jgi:hypothetical protein
MLEYYKNVNFAPIQSPELKSHLEVAARAGAIAVVALYVAGFLVVTFADASHGIVGFGLFRTRVLTAGILLFFLLAIGLLNWSRVFGRWGFPKSGEHKIKGTIVPEARAKLYFGAMNLLWYFWSSLALAYFICMYVLHCNSPWRFWTVLLGLAVIYAGVATFYKFQFSRHPLVCAVLSLFAIGAGIAGLIFLRDKKLGLVLGWFLLVGYVADYVEKQIRQARLLGDVEWHWLLFNVLGVVAFFSLWVYPQIPPSLGGGKPTRVVFQFFNTSPIDGSTKDPLWMLDEVDMGFYVLRTPDERKAVFLPRSVVSAIYFDADEPATPTH